jgi:catalase
MMAVPEPPRNASRFRATDERWSPTRWTGELGQLLLDQIRQLGLRGGVTKRPAHGYGFVLKGSFTATTDKWNRRQLDALTDFKPFAKGADTPTVVRFSNLRAELDERDLMGFAVKFAPHDDEESDLLSFSTELLPVATTRDFSDLLSLRSEPVKAVPRLGGMILTRRLSTSALLDAVKGATTNNGNGFGTEFHGMQTFRLVRQANDGVVESTPFRYRWKPDPANPAGTYRNFNKHPGPDEIRFMLELLTRPVGNRASPSDMDRIDDPRFRWPDQTNVIEAGMLHLHPKQLLEGPGTLAFNPGTLAPGLALGDNDLLSTRQSAYAISFGDRKR